jgi:16S rRNA G966 N2-methylase RsmD
VQKEGVTRSSAPARSASKGRPLLALPAGEFSRLPHVPHARLNCREDLRTRLRDPAFRHIDGFPKADDDTILSLSDPPLYTACPNPYLADFLADTSTDSAAAAGPFAADIRIARHDPYSLAHTYHTKVSPLAIVQYIAHFTRPGDVVLDFFCGSGMTGLAAAGAPLGLADGRATLTAAEPRRAVLMDLSPAAAHIASGHAARFSDADIDAVAKIVAKVRSVERPLFAVPHRGYASRLAAWTCHDPNPSFPSSAWERRSRSSASRPNTDRKPSFSTRVPKLRLGTRMNEGAELEYLVWSEIWICPRCGREVVFGQASFDPLAGKVAATIACPRCRYRLNKRRCGRRKEAYKDPLLKETAHRPVLVPLFAAYRYEGRRYYRRALPGDGGPTVRCDRTLVPNPRPILRGERFHKDALIDSYGVTHVHHFYTLRNLRALGALLDEARQAPPDIARLLRFLVTSVAVKASNLMNYNADGVGRVLKGTLYRSSLVQECNPFWLASIALADIRRLARASRHDPRHIIISTQSAAAATLPEASVDYIWIDPPFGKSLMYAELNQIWEWWLGVHTADTHEAVLDIHRGKDLQAYADLMTRCLTQAYRALKPGRWMTIAFHNSQSAVWNAIQEAVRRAGFILADVSILDKELLTYKQSQQGLPRVDLALSAYKPSSLETTDSRPGKSNARAAWRYVRRHLGRLPLPQNGETVLERTRHVLFDRMVAHHLRRGVAVPLSAPEFFAGLRDGFEERDGMYFLTNT